MIPTPDGGLRMLTDGIDGTFAPKVALPAANLVPKPANLSFEEAAGLGTAWLTAYRMLFTKAKLQPGERLLVQGASGGVSTAAIMLAVHAGAHVTVTSRKEDGAGEGPPARRPRRRPLRRQALRSGSTSCIETVGEATWGHSMKSLNQGGRIVVAGATTGAAPSADLNRLFYREISVFGSAMGTLDEFKTLLRLRRARRPPPAGVRGLRRRREGARRHAGPRGRRAVRQARHPAQLSSDRRALEDGGLHAPAGQLARNGTGSTSAASPWAPRGRRRVPRPARPASRAVTAEHRPGGEGHPVDGAVDEDLLRPAPPAPDLDPHRAPVAVGIRRRAALPPVQRGRHHSGCGPTGACPGPGGPGRAARRSASTPAASAGKASTRRAGLPGPGPVAVQTADGDGEPHQLAAAPRPVAGPGAVAPFGSGARGRPGRRPSGRPGRPNRPGRRGSRRRPRAASAAWRARTSDRPGASPQPAARATPASRAASSRSSRLRDGVGVVGAAGGRDPGLQGPFEHGPLGGARRWPTATTPTPAGSGRSGVQSIASARVPMASAASGGRGGGLVDDEDPLDAVGLRQLPGGPAPDGAGAHQEDGGHRKSGSWS